MQLIPWKPFSLFDDFFHDADLQHAPMFSPEMVKPAMDMYETKDAVIAEINVPDFDPKSIDVSALDNVLHVSGSMDSEKKEEDKDKGYWRKEIRRGSFERVVALPVHVHEKEVTAEYKNGILTITMPKAEQKPKQKVTVTVK